METSVINKKSSAVQNVESYFKTHDVAFLTEDALFKNMSTGEEISGRKAIGEMLNYTYHIAFDAKAVIISSIITESQALLEATFTGKHIGEFAGVKATGATVNVPLCVSYDLNENGFIKEARIYMLTDVLKSQIENTAVK